MPLLMQVLHTFAHGAHLFLCDQTNQIDVQFLLFRGGKTLRLETLLGKKSHSLDPNLYAGMK